MKEEYLKVTISIEKTERWVGNRPLKISEYMYESEKGEIVPLFSNSNGIMILRDREALGAYERFFEDVTKLHFVMFEEEFTSVFFDNELDGIVVEKTMVSEEVYTKVRLVISN